VGDVRSIGLAADERTLIRQLYPPLQRYAAVVAPADVDPEDLVQEAFLRAIRKGPLCDLNHPNAYLRKTICNLASNSRRRFSRERRALLRLDNPGVAPEGYPSDLDDLMRLRPVARAVLQCEKSRDDHMRRSRRCSDGRRSVCAASPRGPNGSFVWN